METAVSTISGHITFNIKSLYECMYVIMYELTTSMEESLMKPYYLYVLKPDKLKPAQLLLPGLE